MCGLLSDAAIAPQEPKKALQTDRSVEPFNSMVTRWNGIFRLL